MRKALAGAVMLLLAACGSGQSADTLTPTSVREVSESEPGYSAVAAEPGPAGTPSPSPTPVRLNHPVTGEEYEFGRPQDPGSTPADLRGDTPGYAPASPSADQ